MGQEVGGKTQVVSRLAMPLLLALFGSACSLVSRLQVGDASGGFWMLALGIVLQAVVVCMLYFAVLPQTIRWWGAVASVAAVGVLSVALVIRCLVGEELSFVTVQLFLVAGMAYQAIGAAQGARWARSFGRGNCASLILGMALLALSVSLTDGAALLLLGFDMDVRSVFACGVAAFAFFGLVLLVKSARYIKRYARSGFDGEALRDAADTVDSAMSAAAESAAPANFEEAQAVWGEALSRRLEELAKEFGLTEREKEVMGFLARGYSVPAAAERMYLSPGTVKSHVARSYRKMGVNSRSEALALLLGDQREPGDSH